MSSPNRMTQSLAQAFSSVVTASPPGESSFAVTTTDGLLNIARQFQASDLHLLPTAREQEIEVLYRIDGVLHLAGRLMQSTAQIVPRLKVLSHLLTYRTDIPQEGRIRTGQTDLEMRVSTFPTIHGEKAVVRFFVGSGNFQQLSDLGLPDDIHKRLISQLGQTTGLLLVCGPAGSGKTTTLYAAMRYLQTGTGPIRSHPIRSLCSLEDPVEALLPGVAQTQVKTDGEMTYQRGLASLLRQDPEVILVGEIRNQETAAIVFQASLTGQLVLSSFHAGSAAEAISRLSDMEIEPYLLRSGIRGILAQRLLRRRCSCLNKASDSSFPECEQCRGTGYSGRLLLCELLEPELSGLGRAILNRDDTTQIHQSAVAAGMIPLRQRAQQAIQSGLTTTEELIRVLGD
ncbi:MAG TPA: ATPase, T2SS/T4P/T4SS family [Planctomicrobium sp.]|nr:ATPase, T2SS/T4P/T4SS family [Planctomicrobium sp.]